MPSQYGSLMDSFCQTRLRKQKQQENTLHSFCERTQRKRVEEIGDGHCGIRCFWRQFNKVGTASIDSGDIRNGRDKLASALQTNSSSIVNLLMQIYGGDGGITLDEIEDRAKLHERCDANSICDSSYYVKRGFLRI